MTLSVVVPFYNVELYIGACLESLTRQTFGDLEVILVDDGSRDGSREVAERYVAADPRFQLVVTPNQGLGPARNMGTSRATGELLAFVDSDDIVPRHAYELMVSALQGSGSDFVAGNAKRFNLSGTRQSWSHARSFSTQRLGTHVSEFPLAALDRMAWNKVYRREFWDREELAFPAMIYEDYPVSLQAHLRASSVDLLRDHVYYWRERDAGETSITQRALHVANLRDRVASATWAIGIADEVSAEISQVVQSHLFEIDLTTAARAMIAAAEDEQAEAVALGQRLVASFAPEVIAVRAPADRVMAALVSTGDVEAIAALLKIKARKLPGPDLVRRGALRRRIYLALPGYGRPSLPVEAYRLDPAKVFVHASVQRLSWEGTTLALDVRAYLAYVQKGDGASLEVWLQRSGRPRERHPFRCGAPKVTPDGTGVSISAELDVAGVLAASPGEQADWDLWVSMSAAGFTRTGQVRWGSPGRAEYAPALRVDARTWVLPGRLGRGYVVRVIRWAVLLEQVRRDGRELVLEGSLAGAADPATPSLLVDDRRGAHVIPVQLDQAVGGVSRWAARLLLDRYLDVEGNLDLVGEVTERPLRMFLDGAVRPVGMDPDLLTPRVVLEGRELQVRSDAWQVARLIEREPEFMIDDVHWEGTVLHVRGRHLEAGDDLRCALVWYGDPDRPVHQEVPVAKAGSDVVLRLDVESLGASVAGLAVPDKDAPVVRQWDLIVTSSGKARPAEVSPYALRRFPDPLLTPQGGVRVTTHRGLALRLLLEP